MTKKPKFNPQVTKVKLNPEQAVLTCQCASSGVYSTGSFSNVANFMCAGLFTKPFSFYNSTYSFSGFTS